MLCGFVSTVSGGCGDEGSGGATDRAAELNRLRGVLSGARDLPEGFSARPRDGWRAPFKPVDEDCRLVLDAAGGRPPKRALDARAAVTYQGDGVGELAGFGLASYDGDDAALHFGELAEALGGCPVARAPLAGRGTAFRVSGLDLGGIGDGVQARRLNGRLNGYPYEIHLVFALSGHTLVSLVHAGVRDVDAARTGQLARLLVGEVGA
ncbi:MULTISPECIES: hypothetical protein [unclassified Streptosporangium]|uniref:hypothetical protein n=1 Tax=unclassified Streptosporangium TaxID=2632669 RepID=UPI002E2805B6|nr:MULTISPECIES: hypothetical protein [unclassified Streptosporangium]